MNGGNGDGNKSADDQRRAFYERHKLIAVAMIVIVFLAPILGVFFAGLAGAVVALVISVGAYYLAPYAALKIGTKW